jgi:hypothetical protein
MWRLLVAAAWLSLGTAAELPGDPQAAAIRRKLDYGLWNDRVHALYQAGELGAAGLPLLTYSVDDADWQIRLTAVHFLGKVGPAAAPALGALASVEPCPHVRISALRWLQLLGADGKSQFDAVITPEDEALLDKLPDRYGAGRMGKPTVVDPPEGMMTHDFFEGGLDLRVCASSERSGRRHGVTVPDEAEPEGSDNAEVAEAAVPGRALGTSRAPDSPPAAAKADAAPAETKEILAEAPSAPKRILPAAGIAPTEPGPERPGGAPRLAVALDGEKESLPDGPPAPERPAPAAATAAAEPPAGRTLAANEIAPARDAGARESMPPGPAAPPKSEATAAEARLETDAGAAKPEDDPVPRLIAQLRAPDARLRARAADELARRGAAAAPAIPALRRALKDRDRRVRGSAALALGNAAEPSEGLLKDLERALRDKDEDVRFSAGLALERLKRPR